MATRKHQFRLPALDPASARAGLIVVSAFTAAAVVATWPLVRHFGDSLPNDLGDPLLNAWILAWDADRLLHGLHGLWDAPIFHPYPSTLTYSEHLLGIAIFTAPVQWLTGNPLAAYNAAFLGSFVLAGSGMYLLATHLTGSRTAGLIGGVAFAFLPYRAAQISHLQVLMYGWMPVALWGAHRYFQMGRRTPLAVFAVAFLLLGLSNGYFFYFFAVAVVVVVGAELLAHVRSRPRMLVDVAVTLTAMLAAIMPIVIAYMDARGEQHLTRSRDEIVSYSAHASSYLDAPRNTVWSGLLPASWAEAALFPGFVVLSLAAVGLGTAGKRTSGHADHTSAPRLRVAAIYAAVGIAGFVLSLGPEPGANDTSLMNSGPYDWLLGIVPGLDGLRVPARAAVLVFLSLAVLAALGVRWLTERLPGAGAVTLCLVAACGLMVEGYHPVSMVAFETPPETRAAYRWLRERPPGAVLELPFPGQPLPYMHGTLVHGHPLVNGYSGYFTPLHHTLAGYSLYRYNTYGLLLRALRSVDVRYLLVHEDRFASASHARRTLDAVLRQEDQLVDVRRIDAAHIIELTPWKEDERQDFPLAPPKKDPIPLSNLSFTTSHAPAWLGYAHDGSLHTRWFSRQPQSGDESIRIQLDQPTDVAHIRLWMGPGTIRDHPRYLVIDSSSDGRNFQRLYRGLGYPHLLFGVLRHMPAPFVALDFPLPPNAVRVIRLRQLLREGPFGWSIHEIELWRR